MSQLAEVPGDFDRMIRIAIAHLERAKTSAPNDWARGMVDNCVFNAQRVLDDQAEKANA